MPANYLFCIYLFDLKNARISSMKNGMRVHLLPTRFLRYHYSIKTHNHLAIFSKNEPA